MGVQSSVSASPSLSLRQGLCVWHGQSSCSVPALDCTCVKDCGLVWYGQSSCSVCQPLSARASGTVVLSGMGSLQCVPALVCTCVRDCGSVWHGQSSCSMCQPLSARASGTVVLSGMGSLHAVCASPSLHVCWSRRQYLKTEDVGLLLPLKVMDSVTHTDRYGVYTRSLRAK